MEDRSHMKPILVERADHCISRNNIAPEALKVLYRLNQAGYTAYLAGGGVRDLLLGLQPKDFDVVTDAHPHEIKRIFRNCRLIGRRFRLAHVYFGEHVIEVSTFRALTPADDTPSHHHKQAEDGTILRDNVFGTPEEDAQRRDFTVNALFYNIADFTVIDYVGGLEDLNRRRLRSIGDPMVRFAEDPVRMLRAARFAGRLELTIDPADLEAMRILRERLTVVSRDRMYEEMLKLFHCGNAQRVFALLRETGLFDVLMPELAEWLAAGDDAASQRWFERVLRQFDIWKNAGLYAEEDLIWSMLYGPIAERAAAQPQEEGQPHLTVYRAMCNACMDPGLRYRIPRHAAVEAGHILQLQEAFLRTRGKRPGRLRANRLFEKAFVYFKMASGVWERHAEELEWWRQYLSAE